MILSVPREGLLYLLQAIFRPWCMVMVRILRVRVEVSHSVNRVRVRVSISVKYRVSVIVNRVTVRMGTDNSHCHVYLSVLDGK